jgi:hypothetical protein
MYDARPFEKLLNLDDMDTALLIQKVVDFLKEVDETPEDNLFDIAANAQHLADSVANDYDIHNED